MELPDEPQWIATAGSEVLIADFHTTYNRLDHWFPRLREIGVRVPETVLVELERPERGLPTVDSERVLAEMELRDWHRAFVRSMYKHAERNPREGSAIYRRDHAVVSRTVNALVAQHQQMSMPLGDKLAFREWLDLEYSQCDVDAHNRHEIRFFIERGTIAYAFPTADELVSSNLDCDVLYTYVREMLEAGIEAPIEQAEAVAAAFDEYSWHVDFVLTSHGQWYCIDMGINGLYYNDRQRQWIDIAQHEPGSAHSPAEKIGEKFSPLRN